MKCDSCERKDYYSTGADEYPPYTTIVYCSKFHWEDHPSIPQSAHEEIELKLNPEIDFWIDCKDYKEKK